MTPPGPLQQVLNRAADMISGGFRSDLVRGTLEDRYTTRDAGLLYHLGWYLVVLNWPEIRGALDRALPAPLQ